MMHMSYLNAEDSRRRLEALDWRNAMHPDDRAWLDQVEAPLRDLGYQPLLLMMDPVPPPVPDPGVSERRARRGLKRGLDSMDVPPPQPSTYSRGAPVDYDG